MSAVTLLLQAAERGDPHAAEALLPLIYEELRRLAARKMANESAGHTLQPTALVHEAYLRLVGGEQRWENRAHFFGAAAEAMRRILIERARRRMRLRHGGSQERVEFEEAGLVAPAEDEKLLQVSAALDELAKQDSVQAEVVKLKFYVGLSGGEIAGLLGLSEKTVHRYWTHAKAWLYDHIRSQP